jgi:site-specific DNA recombinase
MQAYIYARVSSREQEREGYSIPAQRKLLSGYASIRAFHVIQEFVDVESAKNPGRKEFSKMLHLLQTRSDCRIVLVEKFMHDIHVAVAKNYVENLKETDRLYRNRTDSLMFEELIENRGVEVHLVKEGRVISKNSRSQDKRKSRRGCEKKQNTVSIPAARRLGTETIMQLGRLKLIR